MSKGVLIGMAVYSTEENKKDECLRRTLESLDRTVDFTKHKLMLSVNASTQETKEILHYHRDIISKVFWNDTNLGTAEAINLVWKEREEGQHCVKADDDFIVEEVGWLDRMVRCIEREPNIGIIGLKRTDVWEHDRHEDPYYRSEFMHLPHEPGQEWLLIEKVRHVIGTCQLYNSAFLDKIGYLYQPSKYGYDDVLASWRAFKAGMITCFYPYTSIHHIDPGNTPYQDWKHRHSGEVTMEVIRIKDQYMSGERSIYYNPFK
jgi:GT2 family glycosyltransferase